MRSIDWKALRRLRTAFLDGTTGQRDYWQSEHDLESYDLTFAQRIGWKWDYVLDELERREWSPPVGDVVDWGCGSGIAGRAVLGHWGPERVSRLICWDRSMLAMQYATRTAREKFPGLNTWMDRPPSRKFGTLLVSHVLTELSDQQLPELLGMAGRATAIIWVEPGTHEVSRKLIAIREELLARFHVVAPCTHQAVCGLLAQGTERHWCHAFAPSPPAVFTDGDWAWFAKLAGVDLRSLPVSFLALDKRRSADLPAGAVRIIGRPRIYKAHAQLLCCDVAGVRECRLTKRALRGQFRSVKKGAMRPLVVCRRDGVEIVELQPL